MPRPKLHIFLGAGGVGKTTLSASYALYLSSQGKKAGLLSIDPARRLKSALNLEEIPEEGSIFWKDPVQGGELRISMLKLRDSLQRWIKNEGLPENHQKQLFRHPLYRTLSEKVASATETLAPIRMVEWKEQYPETEDLVIDTAPGIHAVDFLLSPDRLLAFFDSKILEWVKWFGEEVKKSGANGNRQYVLEKNFLQKFLRFGVKAILNSLAKAGGENVILSLAELILLMDGIFSRMVRRLEEAREWTRSDDTRFYFVFSPREDSLSVVLELYHTLQKFFSFQYVFLFNKSIPDDFFLSKEVKKYMTEEKKINGSPLENLFQKYIQLYPEYKKTLFAKLRTSGLKESDVIEIPLQTALENKELKVEELIKLGSHIGRNLKNKVNF